VAAPQSQIYADAQHASCEGIDRCHGDELLLPWYSRSCQQIRSSADAIAVRRVFNESMHLVLHRLNKLQQLSLSFAFNDGSLPRLDEASPCTALNRFTLSKVVASTILS